MSDAENIFTLEKEYYTLAARDYRRWRNPSPNCKANTDDLLKPSYYIWYIPVVTIHPPLRIERRPGGRSVP